MVFDDDPKGNGFFLHFSFPDEYNDTIFSQNALRNIGVGCSS